jgi:hypothetical protein
MNRSGTGAARSSPRAFARAVVVRGAVASLALVTASARGGSVPSHAPAHAAPCQPLPWVCRSRPSAAPSVTAPSGRFRCAHASRSRKPLHCAALRSAPFQGGLIREAAVGRGRPECGFAGVIGAPSSPRSKERAEGWLLGRSTSSGFGDAPRTALSLHRDGLLSSRSSLRASRHSAASPNACRTMFRCAPHRAESFWIAAV